MSMHLEAPSKAGVLPAPVRAEQPARTDEASAPIRCSACEHVITHAASRREVDGRHVHLRLNPFASAFIFGCFSTAPGCVVHGPPTAEATWFAGCRWEYAHCGRCSAHLGWAFSGAESFFALLLERLVDEGATGPSSR